MDKKLLSRLTALAIPAVDDFVRVVRRGGTPADLQPVAIGAIIALLAALEVQVEIAAESAAPPDEVEPEPEA